MKFYSGFSLKNESFLFHNYLKNSEYAVCGFSYGAIKAFEIAKEGLACGKRIDTLQLFSPAFFQTKTESFKRLQLLAYKKNQELYLRQFINSCFFPHAIKKVEFSPTSSDALDELLNYEWNLGELENLTKKGVVLEIYLGEEDRIIDVNSAKDFFQQVATVTYIKNANHFLQIN
ncbi:pimelyl-ACP methyl ester esterase BioV [bacterium]|nr:pimelyl-ACP methyl ester esterase BioV [bacterium]MBU1994331.1 pimelyl-ACP methyl ester esterase BioV [bacterium]